MIKKLFCNEHELRAGWRFASYLLMIFAMALLLRLVLHAMGVNGGPLSGGLSASRLILEDSSEFLLFLLPALFMGRLEKRTLGDYGLPARGAFGSRLWEGILWGFGMQAATLGILVATGNCHVSGLTMAAGSALKYGGLWAIAFLLAGFTEEFSFRGYSLFTLATGMGFWPAAILLGAGFALIHMLNPGKNWVGAVGVFSVTMVLSLALRRTGALWFCIGWHVGWDWTQTCLFGVPDSGLKANGYLLNTSFQGSRWMTGGTVGPEASLVALAILALAFALLHYRFPKTQYPREGSLNPTGAGRRNHDVALGCGAASAAQGALNA